MHLRLVVALVVCSATLALLSVPWLLASERRLPFLLGASLRVVWRLFCHQMPERTAFVAGHPCCACYRCTALAVGACLGALAALAGGPSDRRILRMLCVAGLAPVAFDVAAQGGALYAADELRWASGFVTGLLVTYSALRAVPERGRTHG